MTLQQLQLQDITTQYNRASTDLSLLLKKLAANPDSLLLRSHCKKAAFAVSRKIYNINRFIHDCNYGTSDYR